MQVIAASPAEVRLLGALLQRNQALLAPGALSPVTRGFRASLLWPAQLRSEAVEAGRDKGPLLAKTCGACGATEKGDAKLLSCANCKGVAYCR